MLRITVELLPFGSEANKQLLEVAEIWNDGTGDPDLGNYKIRLSKRGKPTQTWKAGSLEGFKRQQFGTWDLLALCLLATLGEKRLKRAIANGGKG